MVDYLGGMNESLLMEKAVPEEDRYENDLIKSIINKRSDRVNAKLDPAEQAVANKYDIKSSKNPYGYGTETTVGRRTVRRAPSGKGYDDINFVDMARKAPERRKKAEETGISTVENPYGRVGGSREVKKNSQRRHDNRNYENNALTQSRDKLNRDMQQDYNSVAYASRLKKGYQKNLDNLDAKYNQRRDDYLTKINALTKAIADDDRFK